MKQNLIKFARRATEPFLFRKALPSDFGKEKIWVSSRSDIRLLSPDFDLCGGDLFAVVRNYVSEGDVVWDIGSNLGILTFCSAIRSGSTGSVYSLEADPRYADIQTRTLKGFTSKAAEVSILCAAAANQQGILDLVIPKKGHSRNHLNIVSGNSAGEADMKKQVVTLTLDWLLGHWKVPDFVKIDVEGAELLVMEGGTKLFSEHRPIAYIECSPEHSPKMTALLKNYDYKLFSVARDGTETPIDEFAFNTLVKPSEKCGGC